MTPTLAKAIIALDEWHRTQQPNKPYRLGTLAGELDTDIKTLARCLRLYGWRPDRVRVTRHKKRIVTTYWIPPGCRPVQRRKRGRPSYHDYLNF